MAEKRKTINSFYLNVSYEVTIFKILDFLLKWIVTTKIIVLAKIMLRWRQNVYIFLFTRALFEKGSWSSRVMVKREKEKKIKVNAISTFIFI